jgi:hypothetical protein
VGLYIDDGKNCTKTIDDVPGDPPAKITYRKMLFRNFSTFRQRIEQSTPDNKPDIELEALKKYIVAIDGKAPTELEKLNPILISRCLLLIQSIIPEDEEKEAKNS